MAVGYDLTHKVPNIIVKNEWSAEWGEAGYYRIGLGKEVTSTSKAYCRMFDHEFTVGVILKWV